MSFPTKSLEVTSRICLISTVNSFSGAGKVVPALGGATMVSRGLAAYLVVGLMAVTLGAAATEAVRLKLPDKSPIVARAKTIPAITLKAATGGPKDVDDVASWMLSGNADTDEAGARAVAVAVAAAKSPRVTTPATYSSMIERVRTAWAMAVCAPRLFRLDVAPGFRPASGTTGGDSAAATASGRWVSRG
jgi:hypothetical protein